MARLKRQPKKGGSAHPGIAKFIQQLQDVEQHELPALLEPLLQSGWQWPRTDMQHWIHPLNRFDEILEGVVRDYDLGSMEHGQTNEFTPRTKELVLSVLAFQKLLLENSTNRKIFNGFDRINDLLHTTDITVLLATLRLALRPAQQYSSYNSSLSSIAFSEKRLLSLAQPWGTREHGIDMVKTAKAETLEVPLELQEPEWQFYRKAAKAADGPADPAAAASSSTEDKASRGAEMEVEEPPAQAAPASAATPAPPRRTASFAPHLQTPSRETPSSPAFPGTPATPAQTPSAAAADKPPEGLTTVHLPNLRTTPKSTVDVLLDVIENHQVPEPDRLDLLQRIRIGKALCSSDPTERQQLLVVRLLALSVFAHAQSEQVAQLKVFLYEPDIISQIAELVHPEIDVPVEIRSVALYALEAFARYKGKTAEVASTLNASVSHGVLLEIVRKTAADLDSDEPECTAEFVDALFNVLTYINMHQSIGQMVIGAGIVSVLLDFVRISQRGQLQMIAANKAIVILDGFLYGYTNAFTGFIAADGLTAFIERVKSEVDGAIEQYREEADKLEISVSENSTGLLSFPQGTLLKSILRAIHRLMTTSGTTEGLRNLIDTSLLSSAKKVMEHRFIFGPQVFALVTNVAATFVHNEPTSLTTLQEAKVPDALYDSLERAIPASNDVLQAVPNAIGAFCLNQTGLDHFLARDLISKYFAIFTSPAHYDLLRDRDSAVNLGSAIDELVRHHPTLKSKVLDTIFDILREFKRMGAAFVPPENEQGYGLLPASSAPGAAEATPAAASEDVPMQEGSATTGAPAPASQEDAEQAAKDKKKAEEEKVKDNEITNAIDTFGRFLEGLFQNAGHMQDFIDHSGQPFELLLDLLDLPCSPAIMLKNGGYSSIVAIFRMSTEVKAPEALAAILTRTEKWLDETRWLWDAPTSEAGDRKSTLAAMAHPSSDEFDLQQKRFRDLTILLTHVSLLSDVFTNLSYAHGKSATAILQVFTVKGPQGEILERIGRVYRACLWENVSIRPTSFWTGEASKAATEQLAKDAPEGAAPTAAVAAARERQQEQAAEAAAREVISTPATPDSPNIKLVQDVVQAFTRMTLPLYQTVVKLLVHRRTTDASHRKVAREVAQKIATFMRDSLAWPDAKDLPTNLAYSAQSLLLVTKLVIDERPSSLQTLLLRHFVLIGGLDAYMKLFEKLLAVSGEYFASAGNDASAASPVIIPVFGALKTALDFLGRITAQKTIFEATQTGLLIGRETDPASPDFLDAPAFLVRIRHDSLPALRSAWEQPWLRKCPQNVIRSLVSTLINVLKAEGEAPSEAPPRPESSSRILGLGGDEAMAGTGSLLNALGAVFGGAGAGGGGGILGGAPIGGAEARGPQAPAPPPDEQRISQLVDMGFPRGAAERALRRCRNSVPLATDYLLQHPDVVGAAREEEMRALLEPEANPNVNAEAGPSGEQDAAAPAPAEGGTVAGPSDANEGGAASVAAQDAPDPAEATPSTDVAMADASANEASQPAAPEPSPPLAQEPQGPSADEMRAALKEWRQELAPHFFSRTLELAEDYSDLVFDVKGVFGQINVTDDDRYASKTFKALLDDLRSWASAAGDEKSAASGTRLRLVALLATDAAFRETVEPMREEVMAVAMAFRSKYAASPPAKDARPIWLAPFMLVADAMLSISTVPVKTSIKLESEDASPTSAFELGPAWAQERKDLFDTALDVLDKGVSTREVFISTLRLLLCLTRDAECASRFVERDGLRMLLSTFAVEAPETKNCQSYATMIMRHLVEEKALLKLIMEREIEAFFLSGRSKVADATGFARGVGAIANRDPETFLEAAKSTVKLVQADAPAHYHITLQRDAAAHGKDVESEPIKSPLGQEGADSTDVGMADTPAAPRLGAKAGLTPAPSATETVVHYLMQQTLDLVKPALAPIPPTAESEATATVAAPQPGAAGGLAADQAAKKDAKDAHVPPDVPLGDFYQSAFSLASLAELVASYNSCKSSFFTFSTKKGASKETVAARSRSSFLFFLLNDLVPTATLTPTSDFDSKRVASMWGWASLVIVGLCYDATSASVGHASDKDLAHDINFVRKAVLDAVARAFRDAMASNEPTETRYARLASLSDLCHRLLTARPFPNVGRPHTETSMLLAKLMLEKNFAVILTNALAEVDLNFPHVNNLINAILRPLENLTKIATKLGRAKSSQGAAAADKKREALHEYSSEDSSMLSGDESDDGDESASDEEAQDQAAADLYRHSALGMYEGELEQGHGEEHMSGEGEEFDDDDEMMEEMDDFDGSDVSDASDDDDDDDGEEQRVFSDANMEELADEDEADLDTDEEGSAINASDVEEEIVIEGDEEDGEDGDELEALEGEFDDGEGDWIDAEDDEGGMPGGEIANGDQLLFDDGGPIREGDEEDDIDDGGDSEGGFTDEEEMLTGELEFDPEMTEQLRAQSTAQAYGWDPVTGGDGSGNRRGRGSAEDMLLSDAMFDRPQVPPRTAPDHPLLTEAAAAENRAEAPTRRQRGNNATSRESAAYQEWVRSVETMLGPGGVNTLHEVLGSQGLGHLSGPDQLRIQLAPGPNGGMAVVIDPSPGLRGGAHPAHASHHEHRSSAAAPSAPQSARSIARQLSDRINAASAFLPMQTSQRWHEEREILQGCYLVSERNARLTNHIVNVLHPVARAEAKAEKLKTEEKRKKEEAAKAEAAKKKREEDEEKVKKEAEEAETKRREEEERATAAAAAEANASMQVESNDSSTDDVTEVMNLARSLAAGLAVPASSEAVSASPSRQPTPANPFTSASSSATPQAAPGPAAEPATATAATPEAGSSSGAGAPEGAARERVTVLIHGDEVDITDTGIDREFLEALPDDMRDEVISQHFRENRIRSTGPPPAVPSSISAEFLNALPPALRAEVMRNEAEDARRQQAPGAAPVGPEAGDGEAEPEAAEPAPGDFLATLDPQLRSAVFPEGDAGGLFSGLLGAGRAGGGIGGRPLARRTGAPIGSPDGRSDRHAMDGLGRLFGDGAPHAGATPKKSSGQREVIQLLDKAGLATLVRLLFFPHPLKRGLLQKVLVNLCENTRTRVELVNLLLTILQDGTRDVSAVDKSFSQMSLRASRALAPKDTPKRKVPDTPGSALPHLPGESVPNLIAQRCLDALVFLVAANDQTPLYFLTEQELPMSRRAAKKGKGKEKAAPITAYPIVVLLGLLERPGLLKTPAMMEAVMSLLASISRSLQALQKKTGTESSSAPAPSSEPSQAASRNEAATSTGAETSTIATATGPGTTPADAEKGKAKEESSASEAKEEADLAKNPPALPAASLRLVVNVLDAGECSSRTFSSTLSLIQNLSHLAGARDIILDELKSRAEKISADIVPHLANLLNTVNRDEPVGGAVLGNFTPASSSQAKLLRILKTIDFFGTPPKRPTAATTGKPASQSLSPEEEQIKKIYNSLSTSELWNRLGDALGGIEAKPDLLYLSTVLLPLIESLLVVNKFTDASSTEFIDFTTAHSKILNTMVRNNPSLMSGSFAVLVRNSSMLDFENKRSFFFSRLHDRAQRSRPHYPTINLNVRRARVFEDSYHVFQRRSGEEIKYGKLNVKFYDEEGVDAGGVTREWFGVLARQMFNPGYALFQPQAADSLTYQPNKSSAINEYHLEYFRFVGRIIGKAIYDQRLLEAYFSRSVYKHILGKPVDHRDLESIDPEYYKSLVWMLDNDIDGIIDLTFSAERDEFGVTETIDLIPNGRNIAVTNENKHEYVRRIAEQRLSIEIKDQMAALLRGLYEVVPKDLLQIFSERELELLISGLPEVEVEDWQANTDLVNYTHSDPVVRYFWRAVRSFSHQERVALLQFVTGSSRVPLDGFKGLQGMHGTTRFNIHKGSGTDGLPTAHTCFNQLDLPMYDSYEKLRKQLLTAITEGATGFAFA